jgi:ring-1,2-phenylacetyl-CoA epoxidase subunit PaaC
VNTITTTDPVATYAVRLADDNVVLGQRLGEYISRAPELEEDLAIANTALDHIGIARYLFTYAGEVEGDGRSEDDFAMFRPERSYTNALLVEQPNVDFAHILVRQFFFDAYQVPLWDRLTSSTDANLAGIAAKGLKEATYHLRRSSTWMIRLGDGTAESHARTQAAIDGLWRFTAELTTADEVEESLAGSGIAPLSSDLAGDWNRTVDDVLEEATLARCADDFQTGGGRVGMHTEYLGHLLAEMQWMQRSHPGLSW